MLDAITTRYGRRVGAAVLLTLGFVGVLIAWAMLQIAGLFDTFTATVILEYLDFLLRVGFAGFVFANVETLAADAEPGGDEDGGDVGRGARATASSAD
jgi:hypothetical protein